MNLCDTSFERAKTALLRGGDVLDCISVPMKTIRLVFESLSPGIRASITRNDREPGSRSSSFDTGSSSKVLCGNVNLGALHRKYIVFT